MPRTTFGTSTLSCADDYAVAVTVSLIDAYLQHARRPCNAFAAQHEPCVTGVHGTPQAYSLALGFLATVSAAPLSSSARKNLDVHRGVKGAFTARHQLPRAFHIQF